MQFQINDQVLWDGRICNIYRIHEIGDEYYMDLLLNERNVDASVLEGFEDKDIQKGDIVIYSKNGLKDLALVIIIDNYYDYAQIRIIKRFIASSLLKAIE